MAIARKIGNPEVAWGIGNKGRRENHMCSDIDIEADKYGRLSRATRTVMLEIVS